MRELVWMHAGCVESELDKYFAYSDDAWEQTARLLEMTHRLVVTVGNMFGGQMKHQAPDFFNASLQPSADSSEAIADDYPWAQPEETNNGQQK